MSLFRFTVHNDTCHCEGVKRPSQSTLSLQVVRCNLKILMRLLRRKMLLVMTVNFARFLHFLKCSNIMKRFAFTLAEVLITLGIIGVVAAITMPPLVKNYKKHVISNQLKKAYNTIQNGIRLSELDNGYMSEWPASLNVNMNEYYNTYWKPYFSGISLCRNMRTCGYSENYNVNGYRKQWSGALWQIETSKSRLLFRLGDGVVVFLPRDSSGYLSSTLYVDVNGPKLPNTLNLDVFTFTRNTVRGISPTGGALLIMQNGWEIPDDYPYKY